jgi:tetratricopeptide (TPR) repeat protein
MLPLDVLLNSNQMSDQYRKEDKAHRFYAESWALTHFLIFGPGMENGKKMSAFLRDLQTEKDQIPVFERTFGKLPDIEKGLEAYVRRMLMPAIIVENPAKLANDQIKVRQLATWEKDAELAALFDRSGGREGRESAQELFKASIEHQPTAAGEEGFGLSLLYAGHEQEALPHFKAAVALDPERYLSAYYYAVNDKELATAQRRELLAQVVKRKPNFSRALFALSRLALDKEQEPDTAKRYAMLAIEADPNQAAYYTQVALIYERQGDSANAIRVAERVVNNFDGPERYPAQKILDRLRISSEKPADDAGQ